MTSLTTVHVHGPTLTVLPGWLPDDWRNIHGPVDIGCDCNGERHRITWVAGRPTLHDHPHTDADDAYSALGGIDGCHQFIAAVDSLLAAGADVPTARVAALACNLADQDMARDLLVRVHPLWGVAAIAQIACADWMTANGAHEVRLDDIDVIVDNDNEGRVGMYSVWGERAAPRAFVMIAPDWYEHARTHGHTNDGRFVCGTSPDGLVVSSTHSLDCGLTVTGAIITGNPDIVFDQPSGLDTGDLITICGDRPTDYDDDQYWFGDGITPITSTTSDHDAHGWSTVRDVTRTFCCYEFDAYTPPVIWPDTCDTIASVVRACVTASGDPAAWALPFTTTRTLTAADDRGYAR